KRSGIQPLFWWDSYLVPPYTRQPLSPQRKRKNHLVTNRQRLLEVLRGRVPDCVPAAPDFSNMIPARRSGKPFWQLYLYNDPPIWEAYIECAKHFDIDSLMDGY